MNHFIRVFCIFISVVISAEGIAQSQVLATKKIQTVKAGAWSDPLNWSSFRVPDRFDSVSLQHDIVVDIDASCKYLEVNGKNVSIQAGKFLKVENVDPVLKSNAVVVDTATLKLVSSTSEQQLGMFKYKQLTSGAPEIKVGSILVGDVDRGYLRKVKSISKINDTLIVDTEQGTMEEVFQQARFSVFYDGDDMVERSTTSSGAPIISQNESAKFTYNISAATLINYGLSRLDLTGAKFDLYPSFQFDYDFGLSGLNLFQMKMSNALLHGEVDFDVKLGAGKKEREDTLKRWIKPFEALVGGIPVIMEAELMFVSKAEIDMAALSFTRKFKYVFDYRFDATSRYENSNWTNSFQVKSFQDSLTYNDKFDINAQVDVKITITPKLAFRVYSVVGPNIEFPTSLALTGRYFYDGGSWDFGISAKSDLNWGADIKIGKYTIENFGPYNLWSKNWFDYKAPFKLMKISGNGQTIKDSTSFLKDTIKVQVLDSWDKTWRNVPVNFSLRQSGSLSATRVLTDSNGYAAIFWKPGADKMQILDVSVKNGAGENITNSPDSFYATYNVDTLRVIKTFNMANTPAFTTNFFKSLGVAKGGYIYAGTINNGFYKCVDSNWSKLTVLTNNNIADMSTDQFGGLWVAQYGSSGAQATTGGVNYFPDSTLTGFAYYGATLGSPTRNVRGIFADTTRTNGDLRPRIWTACMAHITAGVSTTGAVGLGLNAANPFFNKITNGVDISLQNGSIQTIAGNSQEIWAFASVNFGRSQILRYDGSNGNFLGAIDSTNTTVAGLTSNFSARAIYFDERGRRWIGLLNGGLIVKDGDSLVNINFPQIFPSGTAISANAIAKGEFGSILIGTSQGLVIYSGGDVTNPTSYKRLTTAYGLPSNNVLDVIRRGDGLIIVATDAGIAFLKK